MFLKNGRGIFLAEGLDRANQVEVARENCGFGAAIFAGHHSGLRGRDRVRRRLIDLDQREVR
jgi:hypothetical protein